MQHREIDRALDIGPEASTSSRCLAGLGGNGIGERKDPIVVVLNRLDNRNSPPRGEIDALAGTA